MYIEVDSNFVADCLSRPVCATSVDGFDLSALASELVEDVELLEYKHRLTECELSPNVTLFFVPNQLVF